MSLFAGIEGYLDDVPVRSVQRWETDFLRFIRERKPSSARPSSARRR